MKPIRTKQSRFLITAKLAVAALVLMIVAVGQCSERFDSARVGTSWSHVSPSEGAAPGGFGPAARPTFFTQVDFRTCWW